MLILREEAENDIRDAYEWYEGKRENLGKSFILDVELTLDRIEENSEFYTNVDALRCGKTESDELVSP